MKTENDIPAFPCGSGDMRDPVGMTLRDYFAAKALPPIISKLCFAGLYRDECPGDSIRIAEAAYKIADAMLAARNTNQP